MPAHGQTENADSIADAAGAWLLRRQDGLTAGEEAEFRRWLGADVRHANAFAELERTWRELNQPRERGLASVAMKSLARRRKRRLRQRGIFALGVAGMVTACFWMFDLPPARTPAVAPGLRPAIAVTPDRQTLPDGTTVELNAGADVAVAFSPSKRVARLTRGEALFTVAKDRGRPFVVIAGGVEVRAVGTEFSVRYDPSEVDILVTEGRVAVERTADPVTVPSGSEPPDEPLILEVGRRVNVPATPSAAAPLRIEIATTADIERALAWRGKRIEFSATPLGDVLALFNRQNELQLVTNEVAIERLEISGIFWTNDPEGFVRLIETGLHLQTERSGRMIVLRGK